MRVFWSVQVMIDPANSVLIKTIDVLLWDSHHGESFTGACLAVGEAGDFCSAEDVGNDWLQYLFEDLLVVLIFPKNLVENKFVSFSELGKVNFLLSF